MTPLNPVAQLVNRLRRPLRIRLTAPHDQAANALHGLAHFLHRRPDMTGRRIRIDLTIRPARQQDGDQR
jgi:hypothetical protein